MASIWDTPPTNTYEISRDLPDYLVIALGSYAASTEVQSIN